MAECSRMLKCKWAHYSDCALRPITQRKPQMSQVGLKGQRDNKLKSAWTSLMLTTSDPDEAGVSLVSNEKELIFGIIKSLT